MSDSTLEDYNEGRAGRGALTTTSSAAYHRGRAMHEMMDEPFLPPLDLSPTPKTPTTNETAHIHIRREHAVKSGKILLVTFVIIPAAINLGLLAFASAKYVFEKNKTPTTAHPTLPTKKPHHHIHTASTPAS